MKDSKHRAVDETPDGEAEPRGGMNASQKSDVLPIPNGWFAVCWSRDLAAGAVKRLQCFDRELALYRTESGTAALLDAYCPHLGAHLAEGGRVVGETLRCPFHGWTFDTSGTCVEIPHSRSIPPRARLRSWEVVERNRVIFVWHHTEQKTPDWEVPTIKEIGHPDWIEPRQVEIPVAAPLQELMENHNDPAHFEFVHGTPDMPSPKFEYSKRGRFYRKSGRMPRQTPMGTFEISLVTEIYGLGLSTIRTEGIPGVGTMAFSAITPIEAGRSVMRFLVTVTKEAGEAVVDDFARNIFQAMKEDARIWEHKIYRSEPVLSDSDRHLAEFRRWARQFYSGSGFS